MGVGHGARSGPGGLHGESVRWSKWGAVPAGIYLAVFAAAFAYVIFQLAFHPANSELVGVLLVVLTLPWSLPLLAALDHLGYHFQNLAANMAVMVLLALPNTLVLYALGAFAQRIFTVLRLPPRTPPS